MAKKNATVVTVPMDREDRQTLAKLEKLQKTSAAEVVRRLIRDAAAQHAKEAVA